jgi:cell division protein ZapA
MTEQKTLSMTILDREYMVACPTGQEKQLTEAAATLNDKMQEIRDTGKVFGIERIAVMAALNLTHELLQARPENENDRTAINRLADKLDAILPNQDQEPLGLDLGD